MRGFATAVVFESKFEGANLVPAVFPRVMPPPFQCPLAQRLALYRFAYLQMDPSPVPGGAWLAPGLHRAIGRGGRWCELLRAFPDSSAYNGFPVISQSLAQLSEIRKRQPTRPLVLCQTAFEPTRPTNSLHKLVVMSPNFPKGLLSLEDAIRPLYWLRGGMPSGYGDLAPPYVESPRHPLEAHLNYLTRHIKGASFLMREDGRVQVQYDLFGSPPGGRGIGRPQKLITFETRLYDLLIACKGTRYVCSVSKMRLDWFARDVLRLMPADFQCGDCLPDPCNRSTYFVRVLDRDIRFKRLDGNFMCLHLDGDERTIMYRNYRHGTAGRLCWTPPEAVTGWAEYEDAGQSFLFHKTSTGWFSMFSPERHGRDLSASFKARARTVRVLRGC